MAKRGADNYLTDQNWDDEEETEEAGHFKKAETSVLQQRQVKKGKRRVYKEDTESGAGGVFATFTGFSKTSNDAPTVSLTSIGNKSLSLTGTSSHPVMKSQDNEDPGKENDSCRAKFLNELKSLNEGVAKWIKEHVDKNPYCVLTPIFKDYEKYYSELESKYPQQKTILKTKEENIVSDKPNLNETEKPASSPCGNGTPGASGFQPTLNSNMPALKCNDADVKALNSSQTVEPVSQASLFSFSTAGSTSVYSGFTFGASNTSTTSNLSFACTKQPIDKDRASTAGDADEEYLPPKVEITEVKEDNAVYSKRCKLFFKSDQQWKEKGIGNLHIKPCGEKFQLLIRADTNLGNILLNIMLTSSVPVGRQGKNMVTIVCVPNPAVDTKQEDSSMVPMLIRVKTEEDADELLDTLKKYKK